MWSKTNSMFLFEKLPTRTMRKAIESLCESSQPINQIEELDVGALSLDES